MNIIDAIKSGKRFRRKPYGIWRQVEESYISDDYGNKPSLLNVEDILAIDWETEEKKHLMSRRDLLDMYALGLEHAELYRSHSDRGTQLAIILMNKGFDP